jgi:hypothetical protein
MERGATVMGRRESFRGGSTGERGSIAQSDKRDKNQS